MKIKEANKKNILESLEIAKELSDWFTKSAVEKMKKNFKKGLIVSVEDDVVGFLNYKINKKTIRILWIGVKKKFRGKGIGKSLLEKVEKIAKENNKYKILVNTLTYKDDYVPYISTRTFYLKNGFKYKKIIKAKKKGHDDEVLMEKIL